ncbi:MAG TPA: helix-turn-helix transcriptional regulator [Ktedonobacteraceae bacterium]|jgi:transcriptional regulator with XRE-family HTH domain
MVDIYQGNYHYGLTIREYRLARGMTQARLAELWPKSERFGGGEGVNWRYVQDIEHGRKHIEDIQTLRKLCEVLHIPHWKVGLSEYDPFTAHALPDRGMFMYTETLDVVESLVRQIWSLRCAARIPEAERGVARLGELFAYFQRDLPPPLKLERRYQTLHLQYLRLKAVALLEQKKYPETMALYQDIFRLAQEVDLPAVKALALKSIGKELERRGDKQEAVDYLEQARDTAMEGSRLLRAFIQSYLIRVYGGNQDEIRFERAVETGLTLAKSLEPGTYEDGTDFVYSWSPTSAILAEQSWGYLEIGSPEKTLALRQDLLRETQFGQDARVYAWIPLDWARAYQMIGEIGQCVAELHTFYERCLIMQSPHALRQVRKLLNGLERDGYGNVPAVRNLTEELQSV